MHEKPHVTGRMRTGRMGGAWYARWRRRRRGCRRAGGGADHAAARTAAGHSARTAAGGRWARRRRAPQPDELPTDEVSRVFADRSVLPAGRMKDEG